MESLCFTVHGIVYLGLRRPKVQSKIMKRTEPKRSHSWWWDSHISPKNSRWLSENLEGPEYLV
ncbi:hypothetical protein L484_018800 [Morus notabilis]|uniref:NAB domain-containing protein n=1 Tax=Morus notabilis TaxID=981085 RepID=W9RIT2_9ROSA|nr:hypothetical protein L484_018800 [Morus notabilis]